jgi:ATP phosphoribosyltransferase regulatory subunit
MRRWLLPEAIEDLLPEEAWQVEILRRNLLDDFRRHGYELVAPPLLEYVESLLTGSGRDMDLRTFKLVDQISGRTMGIRADITPQVARIDAHLLNRPGVTRLCYCGSILHTLPAGLLASREPLQIGAEIYGHSGLEADIEVVRLLARTLKQGGLTASRIDLGHVGVFRALAGAAGIDAELEQDLFAALQAKDVPDLIELVAGIAEPLRSAFLALPQCCGGVEALQRARQSLPDLPEISNALDELQRLAAALGELPLGFDLSDLRGYNYQNGIVFAAYCSNHPGAIAVGGRYDNVTKAFGRSRAATGFSLDLRELARLVQRAARSAGVLAPHIGADTALRQVVESLRERGEIVVEALPGHGEDWAESACDRRLVRHDGDWHIESITKTLKA